MARRYTFIVAQSPVQKKLISKRNLPQPGRNNKGMCVDRDPADSFIASLMAMGVVNQVGVDCGARPKAMARS